MGYTVMKLFVTTAFAAFAAVGAAYACPDFSAWGASYTATGSDLWSPQSFSVTAGGTNMLTACHNVRPVSQTGEGYFTSAPDFTFDLRQMQGYRLEVRVVSDCDAALLVNSANGTWLYDDDNNGNLDPRIVLSRPGNGFLDIWVGTYDGAYCDATLTLETFGG